MEDARKTEEWTAHNEALLETGQMQNVTGDFDSSQKSWELTSSTQTKEKAQN